MNDIWIEKKINNRITKRFFKHYELGILGCGKESLPFLDMSSIVELPSNKNDIILEIQNNLEKSDLYDKSSPIVPKELNDGKNLVSYYYNFIDKFFDQETLNGFKTTEEFEKFVVKYFKCGKWNNLLAPRFSDNWYNKSIENNCKWNAVHSTPALKAWIESFRETVFDEIGRVIVFNSIVGQPVLLHRDYHYREHSSHFINFQLDGRTNVAFVYDEVKKEKVYIDTPCYMFNECDLHGVDACETPRFTVRIDGKFKPHICESLNLSGANVWDYTCASADKMKNIKIVEPVFYGL